MREPILLFLTLSVFLFLTRRSLRLYLLLYSLFRSQRRFTKLMIAEVLNLNKNPALMKLFVFNAKIAKILLKIHIAYFRSQGRFH